ncbi:MAG: AMMECR1 domain-containing protein [bacterium]|nr:AMMECR1 domain-containing protein [bacterium]
MKRLVFAVALVIACSIAPGAKEDMLGAWSSFAASEKAGKMAAWLKSEARKELGPQEKGAGKRAAFDLKTPPFFGRLGIFVTLVKDRKVRGCFGAFNHTSGKILPVLRYYLKGALRSDPRYRPLGIEELEETEIIVTVTSPAYPAESLEMIDISNYGVMILFENGERAVYVPAEIKTYSYLRRQVQGKNISTVYAFRAVSIR